MQEKKRKVDWTDDRIRLLSKPEIEALHANALTRGEPEIAARCEQALRNIASPSWRSKRRTGNKSIAAYRIPDGAMAAVAELVLNLPPVSDVPNAVNRLELQTSPVQTLDDLWWQYLACGLSSLENSDEDSPLGRFVKLQGPLFHSQYSGQQRPGAQRRALGFALAELFRDGTAYLSECSQQ